MALFARKPDGDAVQAHIDRLEAMPLDALAQELLGVVVAVDGLPFGADGPTLYEVVEQLVGGKAKAAQQLELGRVVAEGLQQLEHQSLVRVSVGLRNQSSELQYIPTRAGHTAAAGA